MIKGPWNYDERTGMVAVYPGEKLNCLDGIGDHAIYSRGWKWNEERKAYDQKEEDKEIGHLVASAPNLLAALKATLALLQEAGEILVADPNHNVSLAASIELVYRKATITILKAEGNTMA